MRKPKFYFRNADAEICYTLEYHLSNAKDEKITTIDLYVAIPDKDPHIFFCKAVQQCAETGCCGSHCEQYKPKNGKSGMCLHKGRCYLHGEKVTFKVK